MGAVLTDDRYGFENPAGKHKGVQLQICEVYNELVKDLLQVPSVTPDYLDVEETALKGAYVRVSPA